MWNMQRQINGSRKKKQQDWSIGNIVKVGFLSLKVIAKTGFGYKLESLDGTKKYEFEPHMGLYRI